MDTVLQDWRQLGISREPWLAMLVALAGAALFGLAAYESIQFSRGDGRIAVVWLPNALAVAFLLRFTVPREELFLVALWLGNAVANLSAGDAVAPALGFAGANVLEIVVGLFLIRRTCGARPDMAESSHLLRFVLYAGFLAPLASAATMTVVTAAGGTMDAAISAKWFVGDALGMVLIAPIVMVLIDAWNRRTRPSASQLREWAVLALITLAVTGAVFAQSAYPLLFLVPPVVLLCAFRLGSLGTAFGTLAVAGIGTTATAAGVGPIALSEAGFTVKLMILQLFLASTFLLGMPVAAILQTRGRVTDALAERERRFALLTASITDAVMQYDAAGQCVYVSPSSENVLGVSGDVFIHKRPSERAHPDSLPYISAVERRLVSGESEKERLTYRRYLDDAETGKPVWIEADCATIRHHLTGERDGIIVSARDVTARVELEDKLVDARKAAERADEAKSRFLANMSHEIRTPMNGVLGFAELLLRTELDREQRAHAELIVESSRSMMALLNDVLDISKIEAGQIEVHNEPVDIAHLLRGCVRLHQAHAARKGVALDAQIDEDIPVFVSTDPLRLRQIVNNLVGNAVKFTDDGNVTLSARRGREGFVVIAIEDTGIGIEDTRLEMIFKPFEQADGAISREFGGTGLGLSISRQLADLLGGSLEVRSRVGEGSCFTLRLPAPRAEAPPQPHTAPPLQNAGERRERARPAPSRVLLVEDHDVNRMLMTQMLERCGQTVAVAEDGHEAIEAVLEARANAMPFDLVLMDIQMPRCDGYTAARTIRRDGIKADELPIVALTANAFPEDKIAAKRAGMQAHLAKPIVFDDLVAALVTWLPVRIVDEESAAGSDMEGGDGNPGASASNELQDRWEMRRSEAIEAVRAVAKGAQLDRDAADQLARTMHKLAGTAGMFGEVQLGEKARNFERALRAGMDRKVCHKLAEELLELS